MKPKGTVSARKQHRVNSASRRAKHERRPFVLEEKKHQVFTVLQAVVASVLQLCVALEGAFPLKILFVSIKQMPYLEV